MEFTREQADNLMKEWVQSESLRRHMYAVEAAMRGYAKKFGQDEELWGITGLLHDFDYEKFPAYDGKIKTGHPFEGVRHLESLEYPQEITEAILGHALYSGTPRVTQMAKTLFACDELSGFVVAVAKMKPDGLMSLTADSVKKKLKDKKFAEKVSREDIELGIQEMQVEKDEHINFVIESLRPASKLIGF